MPPDIGAIRTEAKPPVASDRNNFVFKHFLRLLAQSCPPTRNLPEVKPGARRGGRQNMDVILHIGAHRTASTTFQAFLEANATQLRNRGIGAWTPERTRGGLFSGLIRRPEEITLKAEQSAARSSGLIRVELARHRRMGLGHMVVSEENMIGAVRNNLRARSFYPLLDERLMRFRDGFADTATRIVLTIRAYDTYWASSLAYAVARGDRMPDAGMLERLVTQPRRWRDIVREVAQCFPKAEVLVLPFERFAGRPEVQLEVITGAALPRTGLRGMRDWRNPSPALSVLRRVMADRASLPPDRLMPEGDGRWMPFDTDQRMEFGLAYQSDLSWLRAGADGFARFVEDPTDLLTDRKITGPEELAAEQAPAPDQRGQTDEGPKRAMV